MIKPSDSIVIIGGGLGGLTLGRALQRKNIKFSIYEADSSPSARFQGGSLDMHPDSGQRALKAIGAFERWTQLCRPEGQQVRIMDKLGRVHYEDNNDDINHPEIDRGQLRDILLEGLGDSVHWGYKLTAVVKHDGGEQYECRFTNGAVISASTLIGADGSWSRVRSLLSYQKPQYTGLWFLDFAVERASEKLPGKLLCNGLLFGLADGKGIIAQRNANDVVRVYAALQVEDGWLKAFLQQFPDKADQLNEVRTRFFDDWSPELLQLFDHADEQSMVPRPIIALPVGFSWNHVRGITLLGDAAHVMSPFAGEGANLAMADAVDLADALLHNNIPAYEQIMFHRAAKAAQESADNMALLFGDNAAQAAAVLFSSQHQ